MLLERVRYLVQESVTSCCGLVLQFASRASCDTENMRWKMIGDWGNLEGEIERVRYVVVASCTTATDGCDSVLQLKPSPLEAVPRLGPIHPTLRILRIHFVVKR